MDLLIFRTQISNLEAFVFRSLGKSICLQLNGIDKNL
jgi:hypothetical protein